VRAVAWFCWADAVVLAIAMHSAKDAGIDLIPAPAASQA